MRFVKGRLDAKWMHLTSGTPYQTGWLALQQFSPCGVLFNLPQEEVKLVGLEGGGGGGGGGGSRPGPAAAG